MPGPGADFDPKAKLVATVDVDAAIKDKVKSGDVILGYAAILDSAFA